MIAASCCPTAVTCEASSTRRTTHANYVENGKLSSDPRAWYYDAKHVDGSWWTPWLSWIQERSGALKETQMALGNQNYPPMEAAPGTYVRVR